MRLRKKWWARPEMESSSIFFADAREIKGNWREEFKNDNPIYLELGCGKGKFISQNTENNPNINYIGIDIKDEVLIFGVQKCTQEEFSNVRFTAMDIFLIDEIFDENEIDRIYINFCNPWPKERHKKRRLTHTRFLTKYKTFIKLGSEIWFKTDDDELFTESFDYFNECGFDIIYKTYDLHNSDFKYNVTTEYEEKFEALGIKTKFLIAKLNK